MDDEMAGATDKNEHDSTYRFCLRTILSLSSRRLLHLLENWPCFRGPTGMGQSSEKDLPVAWGGNKNENIVWKVPLQHTTAKLKPDHNQSSPVVWENKIFVTTSFWAADKTQKDFLTSPGSVTRPKGNSFGT